MGIAKQIEETTKANAILFGTVYHKRHFPRVNDFKYSALYFQFSKKGLLALNNSWLCGVNRRALFSYYDSDHGMRDGSPAFSWAWSILNSYGVPVTEDDITLVTIPRVLGYVFNPVSFWFAQDSSTGDLKAVLCEVNNTFGETHSYVCLPQSSEQSIAHGQWINASKVFHVSPFLSREGRYSFCFSCVSQRGCDLAVAINYFDSEEKLELSTWLKCSRRPLTEKSLLLAWLSSPLLTIKVVLLIHYQALKLFLKGIKYKPKPPQLPARITSSRE